MQGFNPLRDLRCCRGRIWNVPELVKRFPFGPPKAPWNRVEGPSEEDWLDSFIYEGYVAHGPDFVRQIHGRFATVVCDRERQVLFLARDCLGETPLHILAAPRAVYVANRMQDIRREAGDEYQYAYVRAFPHAHMQEIDLSGVEPGCVSVTMRPGETWLYLDFAQYVADVIEEGAMHTPESGFELLREYLAESVERRAAACSSSTLALLLSGGLDSFSVALLMRSLNIPFQAYTLAIDKKSEDAAMAAEFAKRLGVKHNLVRIKPKEAVSAFEEAVTVSECYHLFNVYCAVGMVLLARRLVADNVSCAFCGEAVNEAVGDYKDWTVRVPRTGETRVLQRVDHERLCQTRERLVYVWGHASDKGKYNRQLGSGLAKHATSRMIKPFLNRGIALECPYYDARLLARLVAIPHETMARLGGKAGLIARVLRRDLDRFGINEELVLACKKIRLQDGSEGGQGGLTSALLAAGLDQAKAIEIFNHHFGADIDWIRDSKRLAYTSP